MSENRNQNETRIEDWVKAESRAKLTEKLRENKNVIIICAAAAVVVIILLIVILVSVLGKKGPSGKIAYLEGFEVNCGPNGIMPDGTGGFYVTDVYGKKIWQTAGKTAVVFAGAETQKDASGQPFGGYKDASLQECLFKDPWAIAPFLGGIAVSDTENHAVRLIRDGYVETINGRSDSLETGDMGVTFDMPTGLTADDQGNLYVADTARGTIYVISEQGKVSVFKDGMNSPMGICWHEGALYVAETGEHRILRILNGEMKAIAGTGEEGDEDGPSLVSTFSSPQGITVGTDGSIYVSDTVNASVRKIKGGRVETILKLNDGKLVTYPLSPVGMCFEDGKLYVCDPFARRVYVLKQ